MDQTFTYFAEAVNKIITNPNRKPGFVSEIKNKLIGELKKESFLKGCIELAFINFFSSIESHPEKKQTIYTSPAGYSIRIIYWPPGFQNTPHVHDAWTVTGVLHNTLNFYTFRESCDEAGKASLTVDKTIFADAGKAGFIIPPCIHSVGNNSPDVSVSIHLFSTISEDGITKPVSPALQAFLQHDEGVRGASPLKGAKGRLLVTNLKILCGLSKTTDGLEELITAHWDAADLASQLESAPFILKFDPDFAAGKLIEISNRTEEPFKSKLAAIAEKALKITHTTGRHE